jgi:hypothetical protein
MMQTYPRNKAAFLALLLFSIQLLSCTTQNEKAAAISLTLIPPTTITNKVDLDIRAGITNSGSESESFDVIFYRNDETEANVLFQTRIEVPANGAEYVKFVMPTVDRVGKNTIILKVQHDDFVVKKEKIVDVIDSDVRSTKAIGGAWISFYHWSEEEGKNWNPEIKKMTDAQWKEMVGSMNELGMNIIVIQESFRNQEYVGKHTIEKTGYKGKAFYPSKLYPDKMPLTANDPVEAVMTEADKRGMHVFVGVGMYAWFDYTTGSLEWHKAVAKELWEMYGHHPSFYGFYVSEEGMGSLDCFETDRLKQVERRQEVLNFFKAFRPFCKQLAPDKPVMFAPNGWGVGRAGNAYDELLQYVDIISPFAFSRMPEGDLTGEQAITLLQQFCDRANAHLWLDLEAFLIHEKEGYLYPRPIGEIQKDLAVYNHFEKVICYQYPGVFNSPEASVRVGEASTVKLFRQYQHYLDSLNNK